MNAISRCVFCGYRPLREEVQVNDGIKWLILTCKRCGLGVYQW